MKLSKLIFLPLLILLPQATLAATDNVQVDDCSLAIYPHNQSQSPSFGSAASPFYKILAGLNIGTTDPNSTNNIVSQEECRNRAPYDQPHIQSANSFTQFYDGLLSATQLLANVPKVRHEHIYINNSKQDTQGYFKSLVYAYEIKIEDDGIQNTQADKIECVTPVPYGYTVNINHMLDCNGYQEDLWGGTYVTKTNSGNETIILWRFGVNSANQYFYNADPYSKRGIGFVPIKFGNNGDFNKYFTSGEDLTKPLSPQRTFRPEVVLYSKDNLPNEYWSATTTSRVLLRSYLVNRSLFNSNFTQDQFRVFLNTYCSALDRPDQGWCPEKVNTAKYSETSITLTDSSTRGRLFWHSVGNVVSVWQQPTPPSSLGCADLQWDGPFKKPGLLGIYTYDTVNPNTLLPDEKAMIWFKTIYESGSGTQRPLEYRWVSFYGDQNRPAWFVNDDGTANLLEAIENIGPGLQQMLQSSLPGRLLKVAHAAPLSSGLSQNPAIGTASEMNSAVAAQTAALIKLGDFKDNLGSTASGSNPLTDDDGDVFYSGGSEGVILGVQAFYADKENIPGDGPMVATPDGQRQKANACHLELVIQPKPVTCIDLEISPDSLEPNTPVTFTVTPKFQPNNKTIPLNYRWSAQQYSGISRKMGVIGAGDIIGSVTAIPGAANEDDSPTWVGNGIAEMIEIGNVVGIFNPLCPGGNCFEEEEYPVPFDPFGPVVNPINEEAVAPGLTEMLGANVFADVGKTALLQADNISASPGLTSSAAIGASASDFAVPAGLKYGGFKDAQSSPGIPVTPFLETTDNKTWYSGGPANTQIKVQAEGKDGTVYPACSEGLVIPEVPGAECELLKVKFISGTTEVAKDAMVAGQTYRVEIDQANSVNDDGSPITKYSLAAYNPAGVGTLTADPDNAAGCAPIVTLPVINPNANIQARGTQGSTPVSCKYLFTPNAGDEITLLADPHDNVAACRVDAAVPDVPTEPICQTLNLTTTPAISGNTISQGQLVALNTDPVDSDGEPRPPVVYTETRNGYFVAATSNAATCPAVPASGTFEADPSCKYSYQAPNDQTEATVTIKVKQDDGVAECSRTFAVPSIPESEEICLALNLRVNGQYTLSPQIQPGQSYALQASPVTTKGNTITMVSWTESGDGRLVGEPGNPAICPALIDNGTVVTLSVCRYIFASPPNAQNIGFAVRAVPDDGVANCIAAAANYTPPEEEEPFCLYLDLDYTPEPFNPLTTSQMNATVVMSDGSQYSSQPGGLNRVRFTSTNGAGRFSGGYGNTTGGNSSDFRTQTDSSNNTRNVSYQDGTAQSGINVYLSDTNVRMSAACMRQLRPQPEEEEEGCEEPPVIVEYPGNRYCAEEGVGTDQYCWEIEGPGDLIFTNNSRYATGDCVTLEEDYQEFSLLVEDCNPLYRDICWDRINQDVTPEEPSIEKRISKANPLRYTTAVHFSTTGYSGAAPQTETVKYQLEYTPSNFEEQSGRYMTSRIYDPAFSGEIRGVKINVDGQTTAEGGTIEFDVPEDFKIISPSGYSLCSESSSGIDKCFSITEAGPENSYMEIRGISSDDPIIIEYNGILKSGITIEDCREGVWCNEEFKNQSRVDDLRYCEETTDAEGVTTIVCTPINTPEITSNTVIADVVCQYFLTRASGDVFLEDDLVYGVDVSKCYPFKNISSTIVKPIPPTEGGLASTGLESAEIISISHEICSAGQADFDNLDLTAAQIETLKELFGSSISENLSSQICEVGLVPGSGWDKTSIAAAMASNIGKLTRWNSGVNPTSQITDFTTLAQQSLGNVYYYRGNGDTVSIDRLQIPEGSGAWTIIVENANLQIKGNIEYVSGVPAISADQIASLGVIVLDGNIYLDPMVEKLAGAYFVQRSDSTDLTRGNIFSGSPDNPAVDSEIMLTVNGSVYGNIGPLFTHRISSGDIEKDEGAITIRYDQRIIQNPPAGLSDLLGSFSQTQIAR